MSCYVAVAKDPFDRLEKAAVFSGPLEKVLADLVALEYVTADAVVDLRFHDGSCVVPCEGGLELVIFEP